MIIQEPVKFSLPPSSPALLSVTEDTAGHQRRRRQSGRVGQFTRVVPVRIDREVVHNKNAAFVKQWWHRPPASSGSEGSGGQIDEKKCQRMELNRELTRRSRQKKQQHLDDLIREVGRLKRDNEEFLKKIDQFFGQFAGGMPRIRFCEQRRSGW